MLHDLSAVVFVTMLVTALAIAVRVALRGRETGGPELCRSAYGAVPSVAFLRRLGIAGTAIVQPAGARATFQCA
jgi:hypothetical protein